MRKGSRRGHSGTRGFIDHAKESVISTTLPRAYAEAGRFADAVKAAERAYQLAIAEVPTHAPTRFGPRSSFIRRARPFGPALHSLAVVWRNEPIETNSSAKSGVRASPRWLPPSRLLVVGSLTFREFLFGPAVLFTKTSGATRSSFTTRGSFTFQIHQERGIPVMVVLGRDGTDIFYLAGYCFGSGSCCRKA